MKQIGKLFLMLGLFIFLMPLIELVSLKVKSQMSLQLWDQQILDLREESLETSEQKKLRVGDILGTLSFEEEESLPLIEGIQSEELQRGLGHDPLSVLPGEMGNCLIYGHREQFLWQMQFLTLNDLIYIETSKGVLTYKIYAISIVNPTDPIIFKESEHPILTLITCYPFIYFGKAEERYMIKAMLQ